MFVLVHPKVWILIQYKIFKIFHWRKLKLMGFKRNHRIIMSIIILFLMFYLSGWNKTESSKLALSEESWYYGEVTLDWRPTRDVTITNEREEKLVIESAYFSCPWVILELSEEVFNLGTINLKDTPVIKFDISIPGTATL